MNIRECRPYHAVQAGFTILRLPDEISIFKVYYLSTIGRPQRERYEWDFSPYSRTEFEKAVLTSQVEGIGFITAFPYIAKIFRFSPYTETVLDFQEFETRDLIPKECTRGDGTREFACYAETLLAAAEYRAWAEAKTVDDYLAYQCTEADFPVRSYTKLAKYWQPAEG